MTKDELKKYKELQEKFEHDVDRITRILSRHKGYRYDFYTYDKVWLELGYDGKPDEVYTEGSDQYDNYFGSFDADMLTWSDEKLEQFVDDLLEKERKEKEEKEIRRRQMQEDRERKEFERLKQKYSDRYEIQRLV